MACSTFGSRTGREDVFAVGGPMDATMAFGLLEPWGRLLELWDHCRFGSADRRGDVAADEAGRRGGGRRKMVG